MNVLLAAESDALAVHVDPVVGIVVAVVLLAANAFFVAAEIALLAARRARIEELAEQGDRRAVIAAAALRELSVTFSGAQLGITMASLGLGAIAEPAIADLLEPWFGALPLPAGTRAAIAFAVALLIVVFLHMVVGEMLPKNVALADAERVSLRLARAFRGYVVVFRPLIVGLNATANALVRLVGVEPRDELGLVHTAGEISLLVRESRREGALPPQEARVLGAALRLSEIDAEAAMTPRVDLEALPDDADAVDVLALARGSGFTRFPVYHEEIDEIVGVVHVKDVLIKDAEELEGLKVSQVIRPIPAVPETRDLERLLRDMRRDRSHAVLVVDEFGGTAGIVTLEDVLEELVGEIEDEFDPHVHEVRQVSERRWLVPGTLRRDELEQHTGLALEGGESETLSGYLTEELGRLVRAGDQIEVDATGGRPGTSGGRPGKSGGRRGMWRLRVRSLEGRRAGDIEVVAPDRPAPLAPAADDGVDEGQ